MKNIIIIILAVSISIVFSFCSNPTSPEKENDRFAIYLLSDESVSTKDVEDKSLNSLEIKENPVISYTDILKYDSSICKMYLTKTFNEFFGSDTLTIFSKYFGNPFIVVASGERIYLGSFYPLESSWLPKTPLISQSDINNSGMSVKIDYYNISSGSIDIRKDKRIIEALKQKIM